MKANKRQMSYPYLSLCLLGLTWIPPNFHNIRNCICKLILLVRLVRKKHHPSGICTSMSKRSNAFFSQCQLPRCHRIKAKHCHTKSSDINYSCGIFISQSPKLDVSHCSITYKQQTGRWPRLTMYLKKTICCGQSLDCRCVYLHVF